MSKICKTNDWNLNFRAKKKTRFKAGADLTEKVNLHVDINEEEDENMESALIEMKVQNDEKKEIFDLKLSRKKKVRFKAGADLTDKVNLVDVDWNREETENEDILFVGIRLKTTVCTIEASEMKAEISAN